MKVRTILLFIVVLVAAYVVGGNLYIRHQVKGAFYARLSQFEARANEALEPGKEMKITVGDVKPAFTFLPLLSPSNPFVLKDIHCAFPKGDLLVHRLVGTAWVKGGRVRSLKVTTIENIDVKGKVGTFEARAERVSFSPSVDVASLLGVGGLSVKDVDGRLEKAKLSFHSPKGDGINLSLKEMTFHQKASLAREGQKVALADVPFQSRYAIKGFLLAYKRKKASVANRGELLFDVIQMDTGLKREKGGYVFYENWGLRLAQLKVQPMQKGMIPGKLLPVKGVLSLRLSRIPPDLVSAFLDAMDAIQKRGLSKEEKLGLILGFIQKAIFQLQGGLVEGKVGVGFPKDARLSLTMEKTPVAQLLARKGLPKIRLVVGNREQLKALLTGAGFPKEKLEKAFEGMECQGRVCEKWLTLARPAPSH